MLYLGVKYERYQARNSLQRPSLKEVREYYIPDERDRRNTRGFKIFAFVWFFFGFTAIPFTPDLSELLANKEYVSVGVKMFLLLILFINSVARMSLFKEERKDKAAYSIPLMEIVDAYKKTGLFVKGKDVVSLVTNITTLICLLLPVMIYIYL